MDWTIGNSLKLKAEVVLGVLTGEAPVLEEVPPLIDIPLILALRTTELLLLLGIPNGEETVLGTVLMT